MNPPIELRLLGVPLLLRGGQAHPFAAERLYQLLACLAMRRDWVPREEVAQLLWPGLEAAAARRNLRKLLFRARSLVAEQPIETEGDALRWRVASDDAEADAAVRSGQPQRVLELHRGSLLEGLEAHASEPYIDWLRFERSRADARLRQAAARRIAELGQDAAARAEVARRWLELDPLAEDALLALFESLCALGRLDEALQLRQQFIARLSQGLGLEASAQVRHLVAAPPAPPRRDAPAPAMVDPDLVGRRSELAELAGRLARPECRLVTIIGAGGAGKSRLARAALARLAADFSGGAAWIALEDLVDIDQVLPRVAASAAIDLAGGQAPLERIAARWQQRSMLLVLDNAEHLPSLGGLAAALLQACPGLKLLVTSRTRLGPAGEWLLPLEGLPTPDEDETEAELLRNFDAVRLFERRATAALPGFDLQRQLAPVAALVRELQGWPLAIELAAAQVRLLPVAAIRQEIARSPDLLTRGEGGRHDSVRASFEHSWRLLAPIERLALGMLSVMPGGFSAEAARGVADAPLPVLASLVDKSLLIADGQGRFALHPLLRQCAWDQPETSREAARQRHASYYARQIGALDDAQRGRQREAMALIESELENARAAWQWAIEQAAGPLLQAMAMPLTRCFETRGRWAEGRAWLGEALQAIAPIAHDRGGRGTLTVLRCAMAILCYRLGDQAEARSQARAACAAARALGDRRSMKSGLNSLALALWKQGRPRSALTVFGRALRLAESDGDRKFMASACNGLALAEKALGRYADAQAHYERALELNRAIGEGFGIVSALNNLGNVMRAQQRPADARPLFEQALRVCDEHEVRSLRQYPVVNLGLVAFELGDLAGAEPWLRDAMALQSKLSDPYLAAVAPLTLARIGLRQGRLAESAPLIADAALRAEASHDRQMLTQAAVAGAEWLAGAGESRRAAAWAMLIARLPQTEAAVRAEARQLLSRLGLGRAQQGAARREAERLDLAEVRRQLAHLGLAEQRPGNG